VGSGGSRNSPWAQVGEIVLVVVNFAGWVGGGRGRGSRELMFSHGLFLNLGQPWFGLEFWFFRRWGGDRGRNIECSRI
jgi:hypothetical protein